MKTDVMIDQETQKVKVILDAECRVQSAECFKSEPRELSSCRSGAEFKVQRAKFKVKIRKRNILHSSFCIRQNDGN